MHHTSPWFYQWLHYKTCIRNPYCQPCGITDICILKPCCLIYGITVTYASRIPTVPPIVTQWHMHRNSHHPSYGIIVTYASGNPTALPMAPQWYMHTKSVLVYIWHHNDICITNLHWFLLYHHSDICIKNPHCVIYSITMTYASQTSTGPSYAFTVKYA